MILFVSGRCDIPAFYSTWFFNRLQEGYVDVRNPFNSHQISRIYLNERNIDCILFCTKNPIPMMSRLDEITFPYQFQITLTPYHQDIEEHVPSKKEIINAIKGLSLRLGRERVIVRYDPILLTPKYTVEYHQRAFDKLISQLEGYVNTVIISFVDMYKNTAENQKRMQLQKMREQDMLEIGRVLGTVAERYAVHIQTCAEDIDLSSFHIHKGLCMDRKVLEKLVQHSLDHIQGKSVRSTCGCMPSVDIGDYNCCPHGCRYCYANYNEKQIEERMKLHDPKSSVLLGHLNEEDHITIREDKRIRQISLL